MTPSDEEQESMISPGVFPAIARLIDTGVRYKIHKENKKDQQKRFEEEKKFQLEQAERRYEEQVKLAQLNHENARSNREWEHILRNFPLLIMPSQHDSTFNPVNKALPLSIILAPPDVRSEPYPDQNLSKRNIPPMEKKLEDGLRNILGHFSGTHPIEFLAGAWVSQKNHGEATINILHNTFPSIPTLILESEWNDDRLNFRVAFWQANQEKIYHTVFSIPYHKILCEYAREDARIWAGKRDRFLNAKMQLGSLPESYRVAEENLIILAYEEGVKRLDDFEGPHDRYTFSKEHWNRLYDNVIISHCIVAGWFTDMYHLVSHGTPPKLPSLFPLLLTTYPSTNIEIVRDLIAGYQNIYSVQMSHWMPELHLELAKGLTLLPDKSLSIEQINKAIQTWMELRDIESSNDNSMNELLHQLASEDIAQVEKLKECLKLQGSSDEYELVHQFLENWYRKLLRGEISYDNRGPRL